MPSLSERLKQAALAGQSPAPSAPSSPDPAKAQPASSSSPATAPVEITPSSPAAAAAASALPDAPVVVAEAPDPAQPAPSSRRSASPAPPSSPEPPADKATPARAATSTTDRQDPSSRPPAAPGHSHSSSFDFHLPHISLPSFQSPFGKRSLSPSVGTAIGAGGKELSPLASSFSPAAGAGARGRPTSQTLGAFFSLGGSATPTAATSPAAEETRPEMVALPPSPREVDLPLPDVDEEELLAGEGLLEATAEEKLEGAEIIRLRARVAGASFFNRLLLRCASPEADLGVRLPNVTAAELESSQSSWTRVIRENTPLEDMSDAEGLENHLRNLASKVEVRRAIPTRSSDATR